MIKTPAFSKIGTALILSRFFLSLILLNCLFSSSSFAIPGNTSQKSVREGKEVKKQAYSGDPSLKRGYELGYDDGVRAGKSDKKDGKKENPSAHNGFKTAEKKFRHEYGSQAKFVTGYRSGFTRGYKSGHSRIVTDPVAKKSKEKKNIKENQLSEVKKTETSSTTVTSSKDRTQSTSKPSSSEAKSRKTIYNLAEDAL